MESAFALHFPQSQAHEKAKLSDRLTSKKAKKQAEMKANEHRRLYQLQLEQERARKDLEERMQLQQLWVRTTKDAIDSAKAAGLQGLAQEDSVLKSLISTYDQHMLSRVA
jgi:hypothetical protein